MRTQRRCLLRSFYADKILGVQIKKSTKRWRILQASFVQVFTSAFLPLRLSVSVCFCVRVNHTSTERSIQFLMGPPGLHSSSLLIFSCFPFCTPRGGDVSIGPGQWRRVWAIDKQIGDEGERRRGEKKNERRGGRGGSGRRGLWAPPDHRGPGWPLTLIMTSEVTAWVRGCVKVPLRRFTPLLGDDDLMQPPQPVWHDQCCSPPAAPRGRTSISNPATQGPAKSTLQAESMSRRKRDTNRGKVGKLKDRKAVLFHRL